MKRFATAVVALLVVTNVIAAPEFVPYEGDNPIQLGTGGAKEMYKDVEVWVTGMPDQEFEVLGYLADRRHKTGLVGVIRMSGLEKSLAKAAKKVGGDALILLSQYSETTGYVGSSNTSGNANVYGNSNYAYGTVNSHTNSASSAVQKHNSGYAVIRFVPITELSALSPEVISQSEERCYAFPVTTNDNGTYSPASIYPSDALGMIWIKSDGEFVWESGSAQSSSSSFKSGSWEDVSEGFSSARIFNLDGKSYHQASGSNLLGADAPIAWLECVAVNKNT